LLTTKNEQNKRKTNNELVQNLAYLAKRSTLNGVIVSPKEVKVIKEYYPNFLVVTPQICRKKRSKKNNDSL